MVNAKKLDGISVEIALISSDFGVAIFHAVNHLVGGEGQPPGHDIGELVYTRFRGAAGPEE